MNTHKNARTTLQGRKLLIQRIQTLRLKAAAEAADISVTTARKWRRRWQAEGEAGLMNRNSRPHRTRSTVDAALVERIGRLRRARLPTRSIAPSWAAA